MGKILLIVSLVLTVTTSAFAGVFTKTGVVDQFQWSPDYYSTGFKYDVFYYIPNKLKKTDNANSLIFLHGGGQSTMSRAGSARVAKMYIDDLKAIAEQMGFIIVSPSGSGLNWGGHMRGMLPGLAKLMRTKLNVNSLKMGLAGHSMGGMGITRSAHWLADKFAFFMPMAAGMDPKHAQERYLATYFNTTYYHLQGLNDHFRVFIERCENQTKEVEKLEMLYGKKSGFKVEYYNGSHNYKKSLVKKRLTEMFANKTRDLYQKELHGVFYWTDRVIEYNNIKFDTKSNPEYFWLKVKKFESITDSVAYATNFTAKIENNEIRINFVDKPRIEELRVFLSSKMINFSKPVRIYVNDTLKFDGVAVRKLTQMTKIKLNKADPNFNYSSYVDLKL
jgi:hypothetical protein